MKAWILAAALTMASGAAYAQAVVAAPEIDACKSSGLLALQEKSPDIKDLQIDPDSVTVNAANKKVEDTVIKTIVEGDAYIERTKSEKPHRFLCLIGEKGKVLLTFFTEN